MRPPRGIVPHYNMTESAISRSTANFLLYNQVFGKQLFSYDKFLQSHPPITETFRFCSIVYLHKVFSHTKVGKAKLIVN